MERTRKTASELAEMVREKIGVSELGVRVRSDHAYGWQATIDYAPGDLIFFQRRAEEIATILRETYDLAEAPLNRAAV